jgi:hypothetical protein
MEKIEQQLRYALENCAGLGRDAYGDYIDRCVKGLMETIKEETK